MLVVLGVPFAWGRFSELCSFQCVRLRHTYFQRFCVCYLFWFSLSLIFLIPLILNLSFASVR